MKTEDQTTEQIARRRNDWRGRAWSFAGGITATMMILTATERDRRHRIVDIVDYVIGAAARQPESPAAKPEPKGVLPPPPPEPEPEPRVKFGLPMPTGTMLPPLEGEADPFMPEPAQTQTRACADFAYAKEVREGKLAIYKPPGCDKNNREVAGFGDVTSPKEFAELEALIVAGKHEEATIRAKELLLERAGELPDNLDPTLASVIVGVLHHRGKGGLSQILKLLNVDDVAQLGTVAKTDWIRARADQERANELAVWKSKGKPGTIESFRASRAKELGGPVVLKGRGAFGRGLYNRWIEESDMITNDLMAKRS